MSMLFEYTGQHTLTRRGARRVPAKVNKSNNTKRHGTLLVPIFADGIPHMRPTLVFQGTGSVEKGESAYYDHQVNVMWQKKTWCDTSVMTE